MHTATTKDDRMAKAGRKRAPGKRRDRGGRILHTKDQTPGPDRGTPELRARRRWMARDDQVRSEYPLGVMLANEVISEPRHNAGCRYAWLYAVVHGRPSVAAVSYDGTQRGSTPHPDDDEHERWLGERERELKDADSALGSRQVVDMVRSVCVYGRYPRWLKPVVPLDRDVRDARRLVEALRVLAVLFGYERRDAA